MFSTLLNSVQLFSEYIYSLSNFTQINEQMIKSSYFATKHFHDPQLRKRMLFLLFKLSEYQNIYSHWPDVGDKWP